MGAVREESRVPFQSASRATPVGRAGPAAGYRFLQGATKAGVPS